jgi:hypothetical protein
MRTLLVAFSVLALAAHTSGEDQAEPAWIVGEWANSAVGLVRFSEDGRFHLDRRDGKYHLDGAWTVAGTRITLTTPAMTDTCFFKRIDHLLSIFGRCRSNMVLVPLPYQSGNPAPTPAFLGAWANEGMRKAEFLPDGRFSILGFNGARVRGHWTLESEGDGQAADRSGRVTLDAAGQPVSCEFSADAQTLALKRCGGLTSTLIRLPQ